MKSRNGGLTRPSSTSATTHHSTASTMHIAHQPVKRHHSRFGSWHASQIAATRQAVRVATALTAPINAMADRAERAASTRTDAPPPRSARITGSSTHGASIIGSVSDEIAPRVVSTRGRQCERDGGDDPRRGSADAQSSFRASATRSSPQKPTTSSSAHHSRWVTQPGSPSTSPARKKVPCGNR